MNFDTQILQCPVSDIQPKNLVDFQVFSIKSLAYSIACMDTFQHKMGRWLA